MTWSGRVAVVTGGASGIGAATARAFAEAGAGVAVLDLDEAGGKAVVDELSDRTAAVFVPVDVSDQEACREAATRVVGELGRIDSLVNNAASFVAKGLEATTEDWERSLGVNVQGYANMVQACVDALTETEHGSVVNIASISAHIAQPDRWTYNAGKGAIVTMTKCMALDLAPRGIRVNAVSPGWIWTREVDRAANGDRERWAPVWGRFHMLRRVGEPEEVAKAILFLAGDDASFVTAAELAVDGGYMGMGPEGLGDLSTFAGSE